MKMSRVEMGCSIFQYNNTIRCRFAKERDDIKHEFEALKLRFENETEECKRLKISLNEANERISTLNLDLKAAHESLNAEKLERSRVECEKYYLERLLFKFQLRISPVDKTRKTSIRKSSDHSTINEHNGFLIPPPASFRDDDVSVENINTWEFFPEKQKHHAETNRLEETSNEQMQQSISHTDELPNSTRVQSHFTCDICGKSFLKKNSLIRHIRVHTMNINSSETFHCVKCGIPK